MKIQLLLFTILSLLVSSCVKEESDFIKGEQGHTYTSNILGIVIDEEGQPIKDANVTFNGVTKTTDENGVYQFKDVEVSDRHSNLRIKKERLALEREKKRQERATKKKKIALAELKEQAEKGNQEAVRELEERRAIARERSRKSAEKRKQRAENDPEYAKYLEERNA